MGVLAWIILFAVSTALATTAYYTLFRKSHQPNDYDWTYIAGGALLGGFTAHVWYPVGPIVDGLYILPALAGAIFLGTVAELIYRLWLRPRKLV